MGLNIEEKINKFEVIRDIYSGDYQCSCGIYLNFYNIYIGDRGLATSIQCQCGKGYWICMDDDEVPIFERFYCSKSHGFEIIREVLYGRLNSRGSRLGNIYKNIEILKVDFRNRKLVFIHSGPDRQTVQDMFRTAKKSDIENFIREIKEYCLENDIKPNFGQLLSHISYRDLVFNFPQVLSELVTNYYYEAMIKVELDYLLENKIDRYRLNEKIQIDKEETQISKILSIPNPVIHYIARNKLTLDEIREIQIFLENHKPEDLYSALEIAPSFSSSQLRTFGQLLDMGYNSRLLVGYIEKLLSLPLYRHWKRENILTLLRDYVRMSSQMDLPYKKFSINLKARHDDVLKKYTAKEDKIKNKKLGEKAEIMKKIRQVGDEFFAIVPSSVIDFINEGKLLNHCVLSYVDQVIDNKDEAVIFIRRRENIDVGYMTLQLHKNTIVQAKKYKNQKPNEDDKKYLFELAQENGWRLEI